MTVGSRVSVPLRGKGRDQLPASIGQVLRLPSRVSVPLRGKGREQPPLVWASPRFKVGPEFPSPCGERVGINERPVPREILPTIAVSVPLRGKGRDQQRV